MSHDDDAKMPVSVATLDNESKVKFYDGNNPPIPFGNVMGFRQWASVPTF